MFSFVFFFFCKFSLLTVLTLVLFLFVDLNAGCGFSCVFSEPGEGTKIRYKVREECK